LPFPSTRKRFSLTALALCCALLVPAAAASAGSDAGAGGAGTAGSAHLGDRALKRGASGHDVRILQDFLTRAGFDTPIIGIFGTQTEHNVKAFERKQGLKVDGIVGKGVIAALRRAASGATSNLQIGPPGKARLRADGTATAPADAPPAIKAVIAAGNRIASLPYVWGGGHQSWRASGYDCSGSVSFALHGGGLLHTPEDSGELMSYSASGHGRWITIYSNPGHVYMVVAGLRYDTSGASPSRWQSDMRSGGGYTIRHPRGY
jgi:cell wall-associated NlpC family hydrolase